MNFRTFRLFEIIRFLSIMLEEPEINNPPMDTLEPLPLLAAKEIHDPAELFEAYKFDDLDEWSIYAYGVGHFLNDLTASFWFKYLHTHSASLSSFWSRWRRLKPLPSLF